MDRTLYKTISDALAGELVRKHETLGDTFFRGKDAMRVIYPKGVTPSKYKDALVVSRILDKLLAIAQVEDNDRYWNDILGLCLLRLATDSYEDVPEIPENKENIDE